MRSPSRNVVGRNTRTPLFSSWVTLDDGASSDDMTHVGTSRAVLTSCTPRLSMARRSKTTRTGGRRGLTAPRTVSCGSSWSAVVPPTAIASNPARSQCTCSRAASPETHCELPATSAIRPSIDVASLSATNGRRSEEHTSELQSRLHLVCRLLLKKKKRKKEDYEYRSL